MEGQLSFSDCFITRDDIRAMHNLCALCGDLGSEIIPPSKQEYEHELCLYWHYYDECCCVKKVAPLCFEDWKKERSRNDN